jgi:glycosyltransferase involved in cell wall biosynthesis
MAADSSPAGPELSVIVPAHDAAATLTRTLQCLATQHGVGRLEVVVVDDGSSDATAAVAERAGVRVVRTERAGPATARNVGVAASSGSRLAFLDADCFPEPGWAAAALAALEDADLVQGRVLPDPEAPLGPFDRTLWVTCDSGLYQTANLLMPRELFERAGGFSAWVDPQSDARGHFGEDVVLGWELRRAGARVVFAPEALVRHAVFPRGPLAYVAERRRLAHFPALVRRVPELRRRPLFARLFLSRRTAALDLALAAAALAAARRSRLPLAATVPYLLLLADEARRRARGASPLRAAAADAVADLVGLGALVAGSLRSRRLLL